MRKTKVQMMAAVAIAATLLGGCGEAAYELTKEEEKIVVNYAAHVLAKYNKYQKDGLKYVNLEELEEETTEEVAEEVTEEETETPDIETNTSDTDLPAEEVEAVEPMPTATLQEIFGTDGMTIDYVGARISDSYIESDYYALDAEAGKTYLVVGIDVSNTTEEPMELNLLSLAPKFTVMVNGDITSASEVTILTDDFSTYEGTIEAGQTVETVILFQIPDTVTAVDSLDMNVSVNDEGYQIILESVEN